MIGIFDSGVGGMTVARAIEQHCPGYPLVYLGDLARTPYGSKSPAMITEYSHRNTEFLLKQGARLIVIAYNSAASAASTFLRNHYSQMIVDVIFPAVAKAAEVSTSGRIGLIGTRATVNSGLYEQRLRAARPDCSVYSQACPLLVPLVEEGWLDHPVNRMTAQEYLRPVLAEQVDSLVLGCTHYPLIKPLVQDVVGPDVRLVDSAITVAEQAAETLNQLGLANSGETLADYQFTVTDIPLRFQTIGERFLGRSLGTLTKLDW